MKNAIVVLALLLVVRAAAALDAFEVVKEIDRLGAKDLWPGFAPRALPVAIYDGTRTLLFRHPSPPASFQPLAGHGGVFVQEGRFEAITANSSVMIGGVETATVMPSTGELRQRAGLVIHELFHVYQRTKHPKWQANEADLFVYPMTEAALVAQQRVEAEALRRALAASGKAGQCWTRVALDARQQRFALMDKNAVAYERGTELNEGLATYVEHRATGTADADVLRVPAFAPDRVRDRAYATGHALARLLDRFAPRWRDSLERTDTGSLDFLLRAALGNSPGSCAFTEADRTAMAEQAKSDVAAVAAQRIAARDAFLAADGWTIVIETMLFPSGFDPLNVKLVAPGQVLHTRFVDLSNGHDKVHVLDRAALTDSAGAHPIFNGVKRVTITGLAAKPQVLLGDGGVVHVTAEGVTATVEKAQVTTEGRTIRITKAS
jgi:hypothetical protein